MKFTLIIHGICLLASVLIGEWKVALWVLNSTMWCYLYFKEQSNDK
jgi:hypothetical protein